MKYEKVIFVCRDNVLQSPMAAAILNTMKRDEMLTVESRGLIVLFPEPYHSKAYALLQNNGILLGNGVATALEEEDFDAKTLILTMDKEIKKEIYEEYQNPINVFTLMEFAGGSGDILDPYGGDADLYAMFYESIRGWVQAANEEINRQNDEGTEL